MPFLFKAEVKQSSIQGKGVFALEDIPQGTIWWVWECPKEKEVPIKGYNYGPNVPYTRQEIESIKDKKKLNQLLHGGFYYHDGDVFIELRDGTNFMNHSDNYNSQIIYNPDHDYKKLVSIAWRDIKAGDEITQYYGNYSSSKGKWVAELMEKFSPDRLGFEKSLTVTKPFGVKNC